ncbi:endonuclease/exonuclease/phosphatase family protein [Acetobacter garciniae]|uniref:endonuclease/exonuclease/phosphatase family protein n=1 Tax=Acetobacter garciniae TaxID=2817435 RepID=UPI001E6089A1|nr:endonuclease/exonuclease/phosphatase family protein [Acetobacter garciniae]
MGFALLGLPAQIGRAATPPTSSSAQAIRLSTWNLEWLLDEQAPKTRTAPADRPRRTKADYARLAAIARRLNSDVTGLQETDSAASIARLFPANTYRIVVSDDDILQKTALVVRADLSVQRNPDLTALDTTGPAAAHHLRSGLDMTLRLRSAQLRVLVVHLKTGCWDDPITQTHHACPVLFRQFAVLAGWVADRARDGSAFAIIGDFNRRLGPHDPLLATLARATPLDLVTADKASPCQGGGYFIDHIILGGPAIGWADPHSLRVLTIPQGPGLTLSDHCPVSITLHPPANSDAHS